MGIEGVTRDAQAKSMKTSESDEFRIKERALKKKMKESERQQ